MGRKILFPLPDHDFDVTEVAVPWALLSRAGFQCVFATEQGATPSCDPLLLTGVLFGRLGAEPEPKDFYAQMERSAEFQKPIEWRDIDPTEYDGLFLAGGHAPGMRQYLGSELLQAKVSAFWALERPVAAICHGVLVLARTRDQQTGSSVLHGRTTTCLPKYMERSAYFITAWKLGRYYRTYPAYVEEEVRLSLGETGQFVRGPRELSKRGTDTDDRPAFVVPDGKYVSARWPGDSYLIAKRFIEMLERSPARAGENLSTTQTTTTVQQ